MKNYAAFVKEDFEPDEHHPKLGFVCGGVARVKAACEMPRPCVRNVEQAQGKPPGSKSSLTFALS